jgi:hypothetical protein
MHSLFIFLLTTGLLTSAQASDSSPVVFVEVSRINMPKIVVTVRNNSRGTLQFLQLGSSWGDTQFSFEFISHRGESIKPGRQNLQYTRNIPVYVDVPPGKKLDYEIDFGDGTWKFPKGYSPSSNYDKVRVTLWVEMEKKLRRKNRLTGQWESQWYLTNKPKGHLKH